MLVTSTVAKLSIQDMPDFALYLSREDLQIILNGMAGCPEFKLDNSNRHWELVDTLRKLVKVENICER